MPRIEVCPKCGSENIYKCTDKREANSDCFQCGGCNVLLPNSELRIVTKGKHVTTYDELVEAVKESREALVGFMNLVHSDYNDAEKLVKKLNRLAVQAKPRKRGK